MNKRVDSKDAVMHVEISNSVVFKYEHVGVWARIMADEVRVHGVLQTAEEREDRIDRSWLLSAI